MSSTFQRALRGAAASGHSAEERVFGSHRRAAVREVFGKKVLGLRRLGKRIVIELEGDLFLVLHLMIAGPPALARRRRARSTASIGARRVRLRRRRRCCSPRRARRSARRCTWSRARRRSRRSIRGGLESLDARSRGVRASALRRENHTLKRALTDPRLFSGIGNAYSDEILHRARLSPVTLTQQARRRRDRAPATRPRGDAADWTDRLRARPATAFPEKVTAFREGMAVHGRYGKPCPVCGAPVQRIVYADNETNYCAALPDRRQAPRRPRRCRGCSRATGRGRLDELDEIRAASRPS